MIKRFNKTTSLLVAAAAVSSLVPTTAFAADYKRIESEEGIIYSAIAFNGAFVIDGNVVDEDTDAVYYLSDGKYTELEDVDSGAELEIYADKYVNIDDEDYYLDLTNGKLTDDEVREDAEDDAATAIKKKLKKDDPNKRYTSEDYNSSLPLLEEVPSNKFSEVYYKVTTDSASGLYDGYTVYSDKNGNYIDADYNLGKVRVATTGDAVTIENTDDFYKLDRHNVTAEITGVKELTHDSNYIYRTAKLTLTFEDTTLNNVKVNNKTFAVNSGNLELDIIQKISKAQASDDIDDAKYAKSVTNYVIADEDNETDGDVADFAALLSNEDAVYSVVNGKLIAVLEEDSEVTVQAVTLKSKNGFYYLDAEDVSTEDKDAVEMDVNGNIYRLDSGYIYKFDNTDDWDKLYRVDGAMDEMSVYDSNNIVVWNEDDEVYSIISSKSTTEEENAEDTAVTTGWVQNEDGSWNYLDAEGNKVTGWLQSPTSGLWYYMDAEGVMMSNGWIKDNGTWYYLQESGAMKTGWLLDNGTWYYLQANGAMKTGWLNDNGTWYYLNASGAMLSNTTVDGYVLGSNGAWIR